MLALQSSLAWTALLLACDPSLSKHINTFAGPYIAYAHRFDVCPSDDTLVFHIKHSRFNPARPFEKQRVVTNMSFKEAADDSLWGHATLAVRANNEWKENAFVLNLPGGGCSIVREHIPAFFHMITEYQPELRDKKVPCSYKAGEYFFRNQSVSWEFPHFKLMPYGHYRLTMTAGKGTSRVKKFCLQVDCEVIPKPA